MLEAEEHSLATQIKQNELYLRVISGVNTESHLLPLVQVFVICYLSSLLPLFLKLSKQQTL